MLTQARVRELRYLYAEKGMTEKELAERYNVSIASVSRVITGYTWPEVTGGTNISRAQETHSYRNSVIFARLEQGGYTHQMIADELGISRQAVHKRAQPMYPAIAAAIAAKVEREAAARAQAQTTEGDTC